MGFSSRTCLPASRAALARPWCVLTGVTIATACTSLSARSCSACAYVRAAGYVREIAARRFSSRSQTAARFVLATELKLRTRFGPQ